ncbi:MAG: BF3164 family lipoprotein [Bacteroidota bacterium]
MKNLIYTIILPIIFVSCINNKEDFKNFPNEVQLKSRKIKIDQINQVYTLLGVFDSIIIARSHSKNALIKLYNRHDFSLINSFIKTGKGPDEITGPGEFGYNPVSKNIYIIDNAKRKIFVYNLISLINGNTVVKKKISQPEEVDFISDFEIINDSTFALTGIGKTRNLIYLIDDKGHVINKIGQLPELEWDLKDFHIFQKYRSTVHYLNNKEYLVFGFKYYPKLIGYNFQGEEIFKKVGPKIFEPFFPGKLVKQKSKVAYHEIISNNEYIFTLYSGKNETTVHNEGLEIKDWKSNYPKNINIFTQEGNPVTKLKLDVEVSDFIIDHETGKIIAINPETEAFYVFDITNIVNNL